MQKLQNYTLQKFLDRLIEELKATNEDREYQNTYEDDNKEILDIPFLVSCLWEAFSIDPNTYSDFIKCLNESYGYQIHITEPVNNYYGICKAIVGFHVSDKVYEGLEEYQYEIEFYYDPREYGYCQCTPDMKDYREDKDCCGHGCDWWAPSIEIRKSFKVREHSWHGDAHDYWDFEDEFYASDKRLADKKASEEKTRMINELKRRIEAESKKLAELEGE